MQMEQSKATQFVREKPPSYPDYSFTHDKVAELIDLVTKMPDEDATHDRGHK
jgi:hypothetical protein